jgi:LacI family transcriptional regulator
MKMAEKLGYSPNAIARGLVMNRTGLIGVVVADITNPFYPEFLETLGIRLGELGRHMIVQNAVMGSEVESARLLLQQRVDGIIFTTALMHSKTVETLLKRRVPIVLSNRVGRTDCDTVQSDNGRGAAAVADHLVSLGHRRIGTIKGHLDASTTIQRSEGFQNRLAKLGFEIREGLVLTGGFSYAEAYKATTTLLERRWPPTALFCHNDLMAFAAMNAARTAGIRVPDDLSIVGFDNVRQSQWESLNLTTVDQSLEEMAYRAVNLLEERIANPDLPPRHVTLKCSLIIRGTTSITRGRSRRSTGIRSNHHRIAST